MRHAPVVCRICFLFFAYNGKFNLVYSTFQAPLRSFTLSIFFTYSSTLQHDLLNLFHTVEVLTGKTILPGESHLLQVKMF
jgi:hypothetical protein